MKGLIALLEQSIKAIEEGKDNLVGASEELSRQMELLKSIDGVKCCQNQTRGSDVLSHQK